MVSSYGILPYGILLRYLLLGYPPLGYPPLRYPPLRYPPPRYPPLRYPRVAPPPYMLNTQSEEYTTVFNSYLACFMNTLTLNMDVSMAYTG